MPSIGSVGVASLFAHHVNGRYSELVGRMMKTEPRQFHVLRRIDIAWLVPLMIGIWAVLAYTGVDFSVAFLAGMSSVPIAVTAYSYREGFDQPRYWVTIALYCIIHALALHVIGSSWIPKPAVALTPIFMLDYLLLAYLFPTLSGIIFE
jgi:hypothetical protein